MTEDEAKTKWCPFVRLIADSGSLISNRTDNCTDMTRCIGSACMAWTETAVTRDVLNNGAIAEPGQVYMRSSVVKQVCHVTGGYCALLGAPQ